MAIISTPDWLLAFLPPGFSVERDYWTDTIKVSNGKVGFVITRCDLENETWREKAQKEIAAILATEPVEPLCYPQRRELDL